MQKSLLSDNPGITDLGEERRPEHVHATFVLRCLKNPNLSREDIDWRNRSDLDERPTVMVQSPSLSRLTPTVASESAIDRPDPRLNEASTIAAKDLWSAKPRSSLDSAF